MNKAESRRISTNQLFFILFTVRLFSLLIDLGSLTDLALAFTLSFLLCLVASLSADKLQGRGAKAFFGIVSLLLTVQTVYSYVVFTSDEVHPDFSSALLIILIAASVIYAAYLKIEALARLSPFCVTVLSAALLLAVITNLKAIEAVNINAVGFEPSFGAFTAFKCLDLPVIYVILYGKVSGKGENALKRALLFSHLSAFAVLAVCFGVMGSSVDVYSYPAFTLFQLSKIGSFSRQDIAFTGSMLLALFLKCSVLLYCGIYGILGEKFEKN